MFNDPKRGDDPSGLMREAAARLHIITLVAREKACLAGARDADRAAHSGGWLDEVCLDMVHQVRDALSAYADYMDEQPRAKAAHP
jgi:hypothetical protein